jgi:hypothetical protein
MTLAPTHFRPSVNRIRRRQAQLQNPVRVPPLSPLSLQESLSPQTQKFDLEDIFSPVHSTLTYAGKTNPLRYQEAAARSFLFDSLMSTVSRYSDTFIPRVAILHHRFAIAPSPS